ncbi:MAG: hypothetical protein KDB14_33380 [Planctomycetales bacterium]|nr:hypothetical protein [Planctomycetales bacterium]
MRRHPLTVSPSGEEETVSHLATRTPHVRAMPNNRWPRWSHAVAVVFNILLALNAQAEVRTWKDATGTYSTQAEFVRLTGQTVELRRENGELLKLPLAQLSKSDQEYIRKLAAPASPKPSFANYIHPNFCAAILVHPKQIVESPLGGSLRLGGLPELVATTFGRDTVGVKQALDPAKISRVAVLLEPFPGGNVAFLPGAVLEYTQDVDAQQLVRALRPESQISPNDRRLITGLGEVAGVELQAYAADPRTLLIAPAAVMEQMRSAQQESTTNVLRDKLRLSLDDSEVYAAYVSRPVLRALQRLTGKNERELQEDEQTDDAVKFIVLDVASGSLAIQLGKTTSIAVNVVCNRPNEAQVLHELVDNGLKSLLTALSSVQSRDVLKEEMKHEFEEPVPPLVLETVDSPAFRDLVAATSVRQLGRSVDVSIRIPSSAIALLNKSVGELIDAGQPSDEHDEWTVIFRSDDPRIWNSSVNEGPNRFAIPLSRAPANTQYLRLKRSRDEGVIIPVTHDQLGKRTESGNFGWVGTNLNKWNGRHLGVYSRRWTDNVRGTVHIWPMENKGIRGWGFGNHVKLDDGQSYSWDGKTVGKTVFEISVKSGPLTDAEKRLLLK